MLFIYITIFCNCIVIPANAVKELLMELFRACSGPAITYFAEDYKIDHGKG